MDNDELINLCNQCEFTGSQSEIPDVSLSPESQDSLSNVVPFGFSETNFSDLLYLRSDDKCDGSQVESCSNGFQKFQLIVSFESQVVPVTKSAAWTYSELLKRLYVNIGQPCPISIRLEPRPQRGFHLRCSLQYTKTSYVGNPVVQCPNHSTKEADLKLQGHVLRSNTCGVEYDRNEHTGRYSILFPYDIAQGDEDNNLFVFEFKCLTTCLGRLKTKLVFEVECADKILCRQNVDVRICSCPGRDRKHDEGQFRSLDPALANYNRERKDISSLCVAARKRPSTEEEDVYTIKVRGRKNYELLEELRLKLEKADRYDERQSTAQVENFDNVYVREVISVSDPAKEQTKEPLPHSSTGGSSHSKKIAKPHHHNQAQLSQSSMTGKILKNKVSLQVSEHMK